MVTYRETSTVKNLVMLKVYLFDTMLKKMKNPPGYSNKITYSLRGFVFLLDK